MTTDKAAAPVGAVPQETMTFYTGDASRGSSSMLRAMAWNYRGGHNWDHLDGEAAQNAAALIEQQAAALASQAARMGEAASLLREAVGPAGADFCMNPKLESAIEAWLRGEAG